MGLRPFNIFQIVAFRGDVWTGAIAPDNLDIKILTFSAENKAKSLRVRLLRLGGTAGGGGLTWGSRFILPSRDLIETPLGGKAGGPVF